ncbi:hypothetical protein G9A89_015681 [Geosiphon pyriformis]|nr:hypothetical protein G9A89_015681 [Geosiphon pyriformis]
MPEYSLLVKASVFEFEEKEEKPVVETFMALESTSNWADETEQQTNDTQMKYPLFKTRTTKTTLLHSTQMQRLPQETLINESLHLVKRSGKWDRTLCLTCEKQLPNEYDWIDVAFRGGILTRRTLFDAAYNSALNKLYHYPYDAKMIFDLAMALINETTQKNIHQIKKSEYITYTFEIAGYNYKDEIEVYYQIANHTYLTIEQWYPECYALSIPLFSENDENEIEFGKPEATEKIETTPIYLIENQPALQLKYFNNNGQGIKPEKAHKIDAEYDLRYSDKDTFVFKPKSFTKINLKIALEIPPGAMSIKENYWEKVKEEPKVLVQLDDSQFHSENYHVVIEKLSRINIRQLEPQQQSQLKELIAEFANIFAENNNDLGKTDLVQHQIYTGDAKPRQQQVY